MPDFWQAARLLFFSRAVVLYVDGHAHPGMDAALKIVFALGEVADLKLAPLEDACPGYGEVLKAASTFGDGVLPVVEAGNKAAAKMLDLREGVRLAALVDDNDGRAFLDFEGVGFEVPAWIGSTLACERKQF